MASIPSLSILPTKQKTKLYRLNPIQKIKMDSTRLQTKHIPMSHLVPTSNRADSGVCNRIAARLTHTATPLYLYQIRGTSRRGCSISNGADPFRPRLHRSHAPRHPGNEGPRPRPPNRTSAASPRILASAPPQF